MSLTTGPDENVQIRTDLAQRATALGLPMWRVDKEGEAQLLTEVDAAAGAFLSAPDMQDDVQRYIRHSDAEPTPTPDHWLGDSWFLPVRVGRASSHNEWYVALAIGPNSTFDPRFDAICESVDQRPDRVREAIEPFVQFGHINPKRLTTVLTWMLGDIRESARNTIAMGEFSERLTQTYEEMNHFYRFARLLNTSLKPAESLEMLAGQVLSVMPFRWVAVRTKSDDTVAELADLHHAVGDLPCDIETMRRLTDDVIRGWRGDHLHTILTPERHAIARQSGGEVIAEPITHDGTIVGAIFAGGKTGADTDVSSVETQFLDATGEFLGVFHENIGRFEEQRTLFLGTLRALTASIDAKDRYTCGHSERVSLMSAKLAAVIGLSENEVNQIRIAGLVHDVGKIGVPEAVLTKPGRLTDEEFAYIKRHPRIGYEILHDIPPMKPMLPGVLYHHERYDGRGYPEGLAGENIPLFGRIIACADTFDAMSSTRSYRPAMSREKVIDEFHRCAGTQFDPALAAAFVELDFAEFDRMLKMHQLSDSQAA